MLHLYLIRHAEAVPHGDPNFADDDRPLTDLGRQQSAPVGTALTAQGVRFDVILCSPLPRARETVEGLLTTLGAPKPPVEYADELAPGMKAKRLDRQVLKHDATAIALVGHQPDLGKYAARLIGSKKASVSWPRRDGVRAVRRPAGEGVRAARVADSAGVVPDRSMTSGPFSPCPRCPDCGTFSSASLSPKDGTLHAIYVRSDARDDRPRLRAAIPPPTVADQPAFSVPHHSALPTPHSSLAGPSPGRARCRRPERSTPCG